MKLTQEQIENLLKLAEMTNEEAPTWMPNMASPMIQLGIRNERLVEKIKSVYDFQDAANSETIKSLCIELLMLREALKMAEEGINTVKNANNGKPIDLRLRMELEKTLAKIKSLREAK